MNQPVQRLESERSHNQEEKYREILDKFENLNCESDEQITSFLDFLRSANEDHQIGEEV